MANVIVACGSGIATSTILTTALEDLLSDQGIPFEINQCSIAEVDSYEDWGDIIVSSTALSKEYSIPTVNGMGFITGIGAEEAKEEILRILQK